MKLIKRMIPLLLLVGSLSSCNANKQVTVTIDSGLGYFTFDWSISYMKSIYKEIKVTKGTNFANLYFEEPYFFDGSGSSSEIPPRPIYYTVGNQVIDGDYSINGDVTITAHYFEDLASAKDYYSGVYMQGVVGAIKRCIMNNKDYELIIELSYLLDAAMHRYESAYPCAPIGKIGAALADACSEIPVPSVIAPIFHTMDLQLARFDNQCGSALADAYQAMVGAIKRLLINSKPYDSDLWCQLAVDIADASEKVGPQYALPLSQAMASVADEVGENGWIGKAEQTLFNRYVYKAFTLAQNEHQAFQISEQVKYAASALKRLSTTVGFGSIFESLQAAVASILRQR